MDKTNRELAVELTIAVIEAQSKLVHANGASVGLMKASDVTAFIASVYQTLDGLDDQ